MTTECGGYPGEAACQHVKVYSGNARYGGGAPSWHWICGLCLREGEDGLIEQRMVSRDYYEKLKAKKFATTESPNP